MKGVIALVLLGLAGCKTTGGGGGDAGSPPDSGTTPDAGSPHPDQGQPQVSRSLALSADGKSLWVVNTESDSISQIDIPSLTLTREIPIAASPPAVNPITSRYDPSVRPRSIALVDSLNKAYVAGQAANAVIVVNTATGSFGTSIPVGSEPVSVVATADGSAVFVVNHQSATVQKIDTQTDAVVGTINVGEHPWGESLRADGSLLYVTQLLVNPGVTIIDPIALTVKSVTALPDQPNASTPNKLIPNGQVRSTYAVVPKPNDGELWVAHLLLGTDTAQPQLDFESTVFPTISRLSPGGGALDNRLIFQPSTVPGATGSFTDSVSGPRDIAFLPDGSAALVTMAQSEDVMVFDGSTGFEVGLVRPVPSSLLEGILVDSTGTHAYVQGRSSHNVTVLSITAGGSGPTVAVQGSPIECLASDPMPTDMRHGFRLFYTANSALFPITKNFWVSCSSCHPEGHSDAVVWKFAQGPRDTPSNAGGPINTGFLNRQATMNDVVDYDDIIRTELGGLYSRDAGADIPDLQALAKFVNYAIPFPQNPNLAPSGLTPQQQHGQTLFGMYCVTCHSGSFFTDSGNGNPTLNLSGTVVLHDIGTCVAPGNLPDGGADFPDEPYTDILGDPRTACMFDTPTLRGIFATAPYFHDGSSPTLDDAVKRINASQSFNIATSDQADLVAYLKTL
jgi:YVTN family beta-propeller protein